MHACIYVHANFFSLLLGLLAFVYEEDFAEILRKKQITLIDVTSAKR